MMLFKYTGRPTQETDFGIPRDEYFRQLWECMTCGHIVSDSDLLQDEFYRDQYAIRTYGEALLNRYQQILDLTDEKSDNTGRVRRVLNFMATYKPATSIGQRALDVGSGLGVFPAKLQSLGWNCDVVEPNLVLREHLSQVVNGTVFSEDIASLPAGDAYDFVSLNKVIEHVEDPSTLLRQAARVLKPDGVIYVEVPDGSSAREFGMNREEFFIEHLHVFSERSLRECLSKAGLDVLSTGQLVEPSSKFTIWSFARLSFSSGSAKQNAHS